MSFSLILFFSYFSPKQAWTAVFDAIRPITEEVFLLKENAFVSNENPDVFFD